jgi:hypothetical protein
MRRTDLHGRRFSSLAQRGTNNTAANNGLPLPEAATPDITKPRHDAAVTVRTLIDRGDEDRHTAPPRATRCGA